MVDWKDTHPDFTEELQKEWEGLDFDCENASLEPIEAELALYLKSCGYEDKGMDIEDYELLNTLRNEYNEATERKSDYSHKKNP